MKLFNKIKGKPEKQTNNSKEAAKERLHLVLMQDRANVSADFLELMKQEIIEVIKKYIEVDENAIDVRLTNKENDDGTNGAPALYANIPIMNIKDEVRQNSKTNTDSESRENRTKEKEYEESIEHKIEQVIERAEKMQQNNSNMIDNNLTQSNTINEINNIETQQNNKIIINQEDQKELINGKKTFKKYGMVDCSMEYSAMYNRINSVIFGYDRNKP